MNFNDILLCAIIATPLVAVSVEYAVCVMRMSRTQEGGE